MAGNKFQDFIKRHGGTTASSSFSPFAQRPSAQDLYNGYVKEAEEEENKYQKFIKNHGGGAQQIPQGVLGYQEMQRQNWQRQAEQAQAQREYRAELLPELEKKKTGELAPASVQEAQARIAELEADVQKMLNTYGSSYYDGSDLSPSAHDNMVRTAQSRAAGLKSVMGQETNSYLDATAAEEDPRTRGMAKGTLRTIQNSDAQRAAAEIMDATGWDLDTLNSYLADAKSVGQFEYDRENGGTFLTPTEELQYARASIEALSDGERAAMAQIKKGQDQNFSDSAKYDIWGSQGFGNQLMDKYILKTNPETGTGYDTIEAAQEILRTEYGWDEEKIKNYTLMSERLSNAEGTEEFNEAFAISKDDSTATKIGKSTWNTVWNLFNAPSEGILGTLSNLKEKPEGFGRDTNTWVNLGQNSTEEATRQVVDNAITDARPIGQQAYQIGLSTAEAAELALMGGSFGGGASGIKGVLAKGATLTPFATSAYNSGYKDARERGASEKDAQMYGIASGAAEAGTELVSLDHLWGMAKGTKVGRDLVVAWLAQAGIEASEEAASDLLNRYSDYMILGDDGQNAMTLAIDAYIENGYSEEEAVEQAHKDFWKQVGMDALGGFVSGGFLGGGGFIAGHMNASQNKQRAGAIQEYYGNTDINTDTEYGYESNAQAQAYAKNPTQYMADMMDDSTAEGKARKAEVQTLAAKEAQGKRLSASDRNYIEESLYVAENAAQQSEAAMSAREQYQKYANEMAAVPAEYRTASTSITEDEARAQLGKAAATGNVEAFGEVYQKMKNAKSADLRSKADEIYSSYSGMAQSHGITEQQIAAFKTSAQEAYAAGMRGESRGSMGTLSMKAAEAFRAGQQAYQTNKNITVVESKSNLQKASALTKGGKNVVLSGVFSSDGNVITQDGQQVSVSSLNLGDGAVQKAYGYADTQPSVMAKNAYISNIKDGTNLESYNIAWGSVFRAGRVGMDYDKMIQNGKYKLYAQVLGEDTVRAMYDAGAAQTQMEKEQEATASVNAAFQIKKGSGVFEDARADKSDNMNTEVFRMIANVSGLNIRLVDDKGVLGKEGANAYFDPKSSTIVVGSHATAQAFHEVLGEFTKYYNSADYAVIKKAAMNGAAEILGADLFDSTTKSYSAAYGKAGLKNTDDEMSDEMTNDYVVAILSTDKGRQVFAKYLAENCSKQQANSIKDKIANLYKSIVRSIKNIMSRSKLMPYQQRLIENGYKRLEQDADLFIKAFAKAVENYKSMEDGATVTGEKAFSVTVDATGRELSEQQQEFFADSKIRNKDGALKVMHHGSIAYGFSVFDIKKAKSAGAYGRGFYFSDSDSHAGQYGKTYDVYLNIVNPITEGARDITKAQLRAFIDEIANDDDYGIENYGYGATPASVAADVWGKDDFAMLQDINATCVGDFAEAVKIFNRVNGTTYDGIVAPTETIAFYPNQIKNVDNTDPTNDPDIRFSLDVEANADGYLQLNNPNLNEEEAKTTFKIREAAKGDPYVYLTNANYIQNSTWEALGKIVGMDWKTLKERARAQASGSYGYTFDNSYTAEIMSYLNDRVYFKDTSYIDKELHAEAAEKYFGVTRSFDRAGYLDINGKLLDFSQGQGYRVQDHREISDILDMDDDAGYSDGLIQFMAEGNVRMQSYGIDISMSPNEKQRSVLKDFFRRLGGEVTVDFSAINGDTIGSAEYREGTAPSRILNDIDSFFATGEVPAGNADDLMSFRYSIEVTDDGYKYVNVDVEQAQFDGKSLEEKRALAKKVILDKFARNIIGYKEGAPVVGTARGAKEYAYADKRYYTKEAKNAKMRASTELDSLLDVSKFIEHSDYEEVKERHPEAVGGFDQYKILFKVGDDWYVGIVNVMNQENVRTLYDITKIRSIDQNEISTEVGSLAESSAPMDIISRYLENNKKFSLDVDDTFWDIFGGEELAESASILEEGMEALKHQKVDAAKVRGVAHKIRRDFGSTISLDTLAGNLEKVFAYMQTEDHVNYNDMMRVLDEVATPVIDQATTLEGKEMYDAFVDALKGYSIRLTDTQKQEVISVFGSYGEFRRMMMPINISEKGTADLEMLWNEIAEASGGVLDADITEGDMPTALYDALSSLRPSPVNNYGGSREAVSKDLAMRIVEEYLATQSDAKAKAAAEKMRKKNAQYRANLRNNYEKKLKEARADIRNKYYNRGAQMRERNEEKIAQIRAKNRQTATNARRKRLANHEKEMISKQASALMKWLESPTEKHHVPREMAEPVVEFLYALDFVEPDVKQDKDGKWYVRVFNHSVISADGSRSNVFDTLTANTREEALQKFYEAIGSGTGSRAQKTWTEKMRKIEDIFKQVASEKPFDSRDMDDFMETIDPALAEEFTDMLQRNGGTARINQLEYEDLHLINKALRGITHAINQGNKAFTQNATIEEMARSTIDKADSKKVSDKQLEIGGRIKKLLNLDMLTPSTYFHIQGKGGDMVYEALRKGFNTEILDIKEAQEFMDGVLKDCKKELKKWTGENAEVHSIPTSAGTIQLTTAQIMSLYATSKRKQAMEHMAGGFRPEEIKSRALLLLKKKTQQGDFHLTQTDIKNITDNLTAEQRAVADKMQQFLAVNCAAWGNKASMQMYGYEKFTDPHYFPIKTVSHTNRKKNESIATETLNGIERSGFTKQIKEGAKNPILIRDIFDVFTDHVSGMAAYHGKAPAIKDANRWFNYRIVTEDDWQQIWKTVQEAVETNSGTGGVNYYTKLMSDINGQSKSQYLGDSKLISNYKAASVGFNLRVVIQQPTAYVRAMNVINPKYLVMVNPKKVLREIAKAGNRAKENSPIAWWKSQGHYESAVSQSMRDIIVGDRNFMDKFKDASMWAAGRADDFTWGVLYEAVEKEQRDVTKGMGLTEEQFRQRVNDRFDEVVDKTQVVDSTLHRSQFMRSKDKLNVLQSAFMSEPTKTYNMMYEALHTDKKHAARALATYIVTATLTSAAAAVVDMLRYTEDGEEPEEVWWENFVTNWCENIAPWNLIPTIKDIAPYIMTHITEESTYRSSNRMDLDAVYNMSTAIKEILKATEGESNKNFYGLAYSTAQAFSQFTGAPASNVIRELVSLHNFFRPDIAKTKTNNPYTLIYDAIKKQGDVDAKVKYAMDNNGNLSDIQSGIVSRYKSDYYEAYQNNPEEAQKIADEAKLGLMALDMTEAEADEIIKGWQTKDRTYKEIDAAIESGEGIREEIKLLQEEKEDDDIVKHIFDEYTSTIEYNRNNHIDSDVEYNVNDALKTIDSSYSYDERKKFYEEKAAKKAADDALKAKKESCENTIYSAIDTGNGFTEAQASINELLNSGITAETIKGDITKKYKEKVVADYKAGKNIHAEKERIIQMKVYVDTVSGFTGAKDYRKHEESKFEDWFKED